MLRALISPSEIVIGFPNIRLGVRIAEVRPPSEEFTVHKSLFWIDAPDDTTAEAHYYDDVSAQIRLRPALPANTKDTERADALAKLDQLAASGTAADLRAAAAALRKIL
jgi:hypothetical protein